MSTAVSDKTTAAPLSGPGYLLVRRLQSLTGLIFGGYLLVHLTVNATIVQGGNHFQEQVNKIHSLPFLEAVEWSAIFIPFLFHAIYGIWIAVNGRPNVGNYPYTKNVFYLLQRISAFVILFFILFHVLSLKYEMFGDKLAFIPKDQALASIGHHMQYHWLLPVLVYPLGVLASAYHTANGLWTAAITWGVTISTASQRRFGYVCTVLFVIMAVLGMVAVIAAARLDTSALPPVVPPAAH